MINNKSIKIRLLLLLVWGFMVFHYGWIPYNQEKYQNYDLHHYKNMAQSWPDINLQESKPFGYRVLGPWLAGMFKPNIDMGFKIFTCLFSLLSVLLLYEFLRLNGLKENISGWSVFLFMGNVHFFGFSSWDYFQLCDSIASVAILSLWICLQKTKYIFFAIVFLLGVLAKETVMVFVPIVIFDVLIQKKNKNYGFLLASLPSLILFVLLRNALPTVGGAGLVEAFLKYWPKVFLPETWYRLLINATIPFSLIPLIFFKDFLKFLRENKSMTVFMLLVFGSCFLGSNNERILAPIFPIFYLFVGRIAQKYFSNKLIVTCGVLALVASVHHNVSVFPTDIKLISIGLSLACMTIIGLMAFISLKTSLKGKGLSAQGLNLQNE